MYILERRDLGETGDVLVLQRREFLFQHRFAAISKFWFLVAIQPRNVGDEFDLLRREVAVRAVNLSKEVTRVNEEYFIFVRGLRLCSIKEPERAPKRDGVKEVRANRNHHIDRA